MPAPKPEKLKPMAKQQLQDSALTLEIERVAKIVRREETEKNINAAYVSFISSSLDDARAALQGTDDRLKDTSLRMLRGFR